MYTSINTAGTGLTAYRAWIDVIAHNLANVNTVHRMDEDAFQAQYLQARELHAGFGSETVGGDGIGRGVRGVALPQSSAEGIPAYDPSSPLANEEGMVRRPDINLSQQMGDLILAQRAFQANATTVDRSKAIYEAAIAIGKGL